MANKWNKKRKREKQRLCQAMGKQQADIALVMEDGTRKVFSAEEWHDKVPNKVVLLGKNFYLSEVWLKLRYKVLAKNGGCCMLCGRSYRGDGVKIHVDHIRPRSKYPALALVEENLQVLCEDCNLGKSSVDATDWRRK